MPEKSFTLRPYEPADEGAAIELWHRTWQTAYPAVNFTDRLDWWRKRWRAEVVPSSTVIVAEAAGTLLGFVIVNPQKRELDQVVVTPEEWGAGIGAALLDEAKRRAPEGLNIYVNKDNARAVRFCEKHGFVLMGDDVFPRSRRPAYKMSWRP
jgi:putative acetyltransferase